MRKPLPVFPKYELSDYGAFEFGFDPAVDFSECLNEARKHKIESSSNSEAEERRSCNEDKKNKKKSKKSWKKSVLSWWRSGKKGAVETNQPAKSSIPRRGFTSGPIQGNKNFEQMTWRQTSGPLSGRLFKAKRADDDLETSYVTLGDSNRCSRGSKPFGPVYLVT